MGKLLMDGWMKREAPTGWPALQGKSESEAGTAKRAPETGEVADRCVRHARFFMAVGVHRARAAALVNLHL
jgi:hypothetical protein